MARASRRRLYVGRRSPVSDGVASAAPRSRLETGTFVVSIDTEMASGKELRERRRLAVERNIALRAPSSFRGTSSGTCPCSGTNGFRSFRGQRSGPPTAGANGRGIVGPLKQLGGSAVLSPATVVYPEFADGLWSLPSTFLFNGESRRRTHTLWIHQALRRLRRRVVGRSGRDRKAGRTAGGGGSSGGAQPASVECATTRSTTPVDPPNAGPTAGRRSVRSLVDVVLPAGATLVGTPVGGGFACGTGAAFTCVRATLAPGGAPVTFTFSVEVQNVLPGSSLVNTVTVSSTNPDTNTADNTATAATTVVSCTITGAGDVNGTPGNDVICGSAGTDRIAGLGGDDVIFGLGGDDQLIGGDGNDVLLGGDGSDQLVGGNGDDRLYGGGGGVDRLAGGPGDDYLNTVDGSTDDLLVGGEHVTGDTCVGDPGDAKALCEK